jgi:hypothetical protein
MCATAAKRWNKPIGRMAAPRPAILAAQVKSNLQLPLDSKTGSRWAI